MGMCVHARVGNVCCAGSNLVGAGSDLVGVGRVTWWVPASMWVCGHVCGRALKRPCRSASHTFPLMPPPSHLSTPPLPLAPPPPPHTHTHRHLPPLTSLTTTPVLLSTTPPPHMPPPPPFTHTHQKEPTPDSRGLLKSPGAMDFFRILNEQIAVSA